LEISPESLCEPSPKQPERLRNISDRNAQGSRLFDRATNNEISEVRHECPELFSGWTDEDWDELYSTFGEGGSLNQEGVVEFAQKINRKRETLHKLQVVLETHLCPVAVNLIETLYEMVRIQSNPAESEDPAAPIVPHQSEDLTECHLAAANAFLQSSEATTGRQGE
jgi:hypothetical protein